MVLRQDPHDLTGHIAPDGERAEVIKVMDPQLSEAPCGGPVALPGLWLHEEVATERGEMGQELPQTAVPVVQMNPHGYRHAEDNVKNRTPKLA